MILILIRHGEADHNVDKIFDSKLDSKCFLTDKGIEQIKMASDKVSSFLEDNSFYKVSRIFCSPLMRTVQSAKIFKEFVKNKDLYKDDRLCIDYNLREVDMGEFDGKLVEDYPYGDWDFTKNDKFRGEISLDVRKRMVSFYKKLNDYNTNVIISHGEPIRQIYKYITGDDIHPKKGEPIIMDIMSLNEYTVTFL